MNLDWVPRIEYAGTTLDLTLPQRLWTPRTTSIGGGEFSASGVGAAYRVRQDRDLIVTLRFYEQQWPAVEAWLTWAQWLQSFDWFPDKREPAWYEAVLVAPMMDEEIQPTRDVDFPLVWELPVTLRTTDGSGWDDAYFRED